ncbi:MAG TPA: hypothetical protein IAB12_04890 [Candidatus Ornithospirochaeta avicola]|uniref:Uncharacterized protein n=1 Tax=Candidatus Ornithospirochaeta avicola TaxID=2840896 RepID=A0A9D1PTL0_9SPIO|nr:hypothetical protein [Candidatus Ornithospirochaeta avicola]
MRKITALFLTIILLSSCSVMRVSDAEKNINLPFYENLEETRFSVLEEERQAHIQWMEENAVYEYPSDVESIEIPHNYRPLRTREQIDTRCNAISILFIPLENPDIERIASSIRAYSYDFLIATGERSDLVNLSKRIGKDSVLLEDALIIYRTDLYAMDEDSAVFKVNDEEYLEIAAANTFKGLPEESEADEYFSSLSGDAEVLSAISISAEDVIVALSSSQPSSADWNAITGYSYRSAHDFENSRFFEENGFEDVYLKTHYSPETDSGITRENGSVYERMDFLYSKSVLPVRSFTLALSGNDARAIYAEVLL